jgi:L-threonylcarbamoyladenylate synthase|tara:strand:+ start:155 stop:757 length:603 start_codon:yes stop_codon:yes gene_type:complete
MQQFTTSTLDINEIAKIVDNGGIIAYPTDTVYGLGCNPYIPDSVTKIFEIKLRTNKPLPLLCSSIEFASKIASFDSISLKLAEEFWPGPLTILVPITDDSLKTLTCGSNFIGLRVPDNVVTLSLLSKCDGYLVGTSANISGSGSNYYASSVISQLPNIDAILVDDIKNKSKESTIIKVENNDITIIRQGSLDSQSINNIL